MASKLRDVSLITWVAFESVSERVSLNGQLMESNKPQIRMKKFRNTGPMILRRIIGGLHTQRRFLPIIAVAAGFLAVSNAVATEINLVTGTAGATTSGSFPSGTTPASASTGTAGPDAIYELIDTHPAGTGVFQPFLSYQRKDTEE